MRGAAGNGGPYRDALEAFPWVDGDGVRLSGRDEDGRAGLAGVRAQWFSLQSIAMTRSNKARLLCARASDT